jgi:predicted MPP superfamily phosphohydrolase
MHAVSRHWLWFLALLFLVACQGQPGPAADQRVRFGIITDLHHADRPTASGRFYQSALAKADLFISAMNAAGPDFIIELGDFKDQDATPDKSNTLKYLSTIEAHFAAFPGARYHVLGNHDLDSLAKSDFQARVTNTNIPKEQTYYSFDAQGFHFIVLDACFKSDNTAYDSGNYTWQDANIPPQELAWLAEDLRVHRLPTVVFVHQRLDLADTQDICIKQSSQVRHVLEESRHVLAVFSGHDHKGAYKLNNGIHYFTLVGTIETAEDPVAGNAYSLVTVSSTASNTFTVDVQGVGKQPSRNLTATLSNDAP